MLWLVRFLALGAMLAFGAPAWAQNTWDSNGNLNVNVAGRGNTFGVLKVKPDPVTWSLATASTRTTASGTIMAAGPTDAVVCNTTTASGGTLWLMLSGGTAVAATGVPVAPGNGCVILSGLPTGTAITGISDSGTVSYTITTGVRA